MMKAVDAHSGDCITAVIKVCMLVTNPVTNDPRVRREAATLSRSGYQVVVIESAGIPVQRIHTFGVAKAYDTKVGTHTFITQMNDADPLTAGLPVRSLYARWASLRLRASTSSTAVRIV